MNLHGLTVLVTRPEAQAAALCDVVTKAGGQAYSLPILRIAGVPATAELLAQLDGCYDLAVFTSVNAVRLALAMKPQPNQWPAQIAAVGAATAKAIIDAALGHPITPVGEYSTEGLLALPAMHQLAGKKLLLVTGRGGRLALEASLVERGASVTRAEVYERVAVQIETNKVSHAVKNCAAIVITSGETLQQLMRITPDAVRATLQKRALVVPSERVLQMAQALGFAGRLICAQPMSDHGILRALASLASSGE